MEELKGRVRDELRRRLQERGGRPELGEQELFDAVEQLFRVALERRQNGALLLAEMLGDEEDWRLDTPLKLSSHRPVSGRFIIFFKRRVLLPLMRWLYEFNLGHFRRQHRLNETVFACLEALAVENARLRRDLVTLKDSLTSSARSDEH